MSNAPKMEWASLWATTFWGLLLIFAAVEASEFKFGSRFEGV